MVTEREETGTLKHQPSEEQRANHALNNYGQ